MVVIKHENRARPGRYLLAQITHTALKIEEGPILLPRKGLPRVCLTPDL
jgi:hypothetical protein